MLGPGKYDLECEHVRKMAGAQGVILLVLNGDRGTGFSAQIPAEGFDMIPNVLRQVAGQTDCNLIFNKFAKAVCNRLATKKVHFVALTEQIGD